MAKIIECVPNFSEGRSRATVDALVKAMSGFAGAWVLDCHVDLDHNRSVITLAGEPEAVAKAVLRGIGRAVDLIDLRRHQGVHPRVGATDVVPFVPIENITIEQCTSLARRVGRDIWDRFRIPVYFYQAAAQRPDRVNLENVRRGQFEGLREEVLKNPERSPDVGEPRLHPSAGATIVGARNFLIAFNIILSTSDVSVAKRVAQAIRSSSGGLPFVKAMGVMLKSRNLAQISTNLTDFTQTPIPVVLETACNEAAKYGVTVCGTEIIGLVPRRAMEMAAGYDLRLENYSDEQVLENRLAKALAGSAVAAS